MIGRRAVSPDSDLKLVAARTESPGVHGSEIVRDAWRTHRSLVVVSVLAVAVTVALLPIADRPEGSATSFAPVTLAVVSCIDVLSVFLLVGEFRDAGDRRVLGMAWAYLWALVLVTGYTLAIPGVIVHPPFAITPSVAPWLYIAWHLGFPVLLGLAWVPFPQRIEPVVSVADRGRVLARTTTLVIGLASLTVACCVLGAHRLPVIIQGLDTSRMTTITAPVVVPLVTLSLLASFRGSFRRTGPERWSSVAILICLCDLVLVYTAHYRFDLGWYVGLSHDMSAAGLILMAMLGDLRRVKADAQHNAAHDPLTGLFNRRVAYSSLETCISRSRRTGTPLAALLLDLDHFKLVNDELGHGVGDRLLADVAAVLTSAVRGGDLLARVGGEEFLVILPDTDLAGATTVAENVREALTEVAVPGLAHLVTGSIGVTRLLPGDAANHLLRRADQAMYRAKHAGRDRVVVISDAEPLLPSPGPEHAATTAAQGAVTRRP